MYHADPVINDFMLTIINDGHGEQCGMTYAQRCEAADTGIFKFRAACRAYDRYRNTHYEAKSRATRQQVLEAASLIQEYYRNHVAEMEVVQS